jgi:dTDP-4-dehydrorhamnose 3,5-epimerase
MEISPTPISGLLLIQTRVFCDHRGAFFESYNPSLGEHTAQPGNFVQDNHSVSLKGVLRGLHFQIPPYQQGKLVRVIQGRALDVVVDIRKGSQTYGQHYKVMLEGPGHKMLWVPPGLAHGFLALEDNTIFLYKCTAPYNKESERGLMWNDPELGIDWGINTPLMAAKDLEYPAFREMEPFF